MTQPQTTSIAFVGCGYVADLYMTALSIHPELKLAGVWDHDAGRLARFTEFHGLRAYGSLDELLADVGLQIVVNLTNPASHFEISRAALEAGKHVYSEKPFAMETDQARALVELARERGLKLTSAPCNLLSETAQTMWKALREQVVGPVRAVYAELDDGMIHKTAYRSWVSKSGAPWPYKDEFEVGCTLEHAGYYLTWLCAFFGPVKEVTSFASVTIPGSEKVPGETLSVETPDLTVACLRHDSGVVSRLTCSIVAPHDHRLRVFGDAGVLSTEDCWHYRERPTLRRLIRIRRRTMLNPIPTRLPLIGAQLPAVPRTGAAAMDFARGIVDLAEAIREGRQPRLTPEFCLHVNEVTLAIQRPGSMGVPFMPTTTFDPIEPMPWAREDVSPSPGPDAATEVAGPVAASTSDGETLQTRPIRWGIIGTGNIAIQFARGLASVSDAELVAVASRAQSRAQQFANHFDANHAHGDYAALCNDPAVDVVYIATPNSRHRDDCLLALNAGKHVLCEKPFALNAAEAAEVIDLAREKNLFCMEAMWMRFIPAVRGAIEAVKRGQIGRPRMLIGDFSIPFPPDPASRLLSPELGGGSLLDLGVYPISLAFALFGPPEQVESVATMADTGVDEQSVTTLRFSDGRLASLTCSLSGYGPSRATILGTAGRLSLDEPICRPASFAIDPAPVGQPETIETLSAGGGRIGRLGRHPAVKKVAKAGLKGLSLVRGGGGGGGFTGNGYPHEIEEVNRCLRAGRTESTLMPLDETLAILQTLDQIRGQW